jgi:hypothetical protein
MPARLRSAGANGYEVGRTIAVARSRGALLRQAIANFANARATPSTGTTATTYFFDRPRAVVDDCVDFTLRRRVAEAYDHG